jgi:two-component system NtrC family sensor kinase
LKKVRLPRTLKFKVSFHLAIALTLAVGIFTILITRHHRHQLFQEAVSAVGQLSEVITKSTRFAMLQNQRATVYRIIQDVGGQEGIERVRVLGKDGVIIHSTYLPEIATKVDREAEGCLGCHGVGKAQRTESSNENSWVFETLEGNRQLGHMDVIRNEPSCYQNTLCHAHSEEQTVLGVLEITYSLDPLERSIREDTITIAGFSLGLVVLASLMARFFIHRLVYYPLIDLERGAKRLSSGNLNELIPVRSRDEFGHLASSFNGMMLALRNSELEREEWNRTLEKKVKEKTEELELARAEMVQAEKMASVGLLAAGIAHELNNPLTGVLTFSSLLRKNVVDGSPEAEDLDLVVRETKRCSSIIKRLLDFAREKAPEKAFIDINAVVSETVQLVEHPASFGDIEMKLELEEGLPLLWIDANQIKQVIMNILLNARDAIEGEGSITIRTGRLPGVRPPAPGEEAVPMVEIAITDTGTGIPRENLAKVFDPFFTSKAVGKGTGLGLSVSYGIARAHGGNIEVESSLGEGSTFRVLLPLQETVAETAGARDDSQNTGN